MTSNANQYTWAGRFSEPVSDLVKRYTASVDFDQRMWRQDIRGSLAHAKMLRAVNTASVRGALVSGNGPVLTVRRAIAIASSARIGLPVTIMSSALAARSLCSRRSLRMKAPIAATGSAG